MIDVKLINDVKFATSFRGYDKDEVDQFLEELASMAEFSNAAEAHSEREAAELAARCEELKNADEKARAERKRMLDEAKKVLESARARERKAASPDVAAAGAVTQTKFESERAIAAAKQEAMRITSEAHERARARIEAADKEARTRAEASDREALERAQASDRETFERAQASDRAAKDRAAASDRRAEERANAILQEAQGNADYMTGEARVRAEQIVAEAEEKAKELLRNAHASIAAKREEFERLRSASLEFSGEYNRLLAEQLREMTLLAEKVNGIDFGDIAEALTDEIADGLSAADALEAVQLDDVDSILATVTPIPDHGAQDSTEDSAEVTGTADTQDEASSAEDDDTYDFVGIDAGSDTLDLDLFNASTLSDDDLDRIFSFDVEEIMNEGQSDKPDEAK